MTKNEMIHQIETLIGCLRRDEGDIKDLLNSRLEWISKDDLADHYYETMYGFYEQHPHDFKEDYYWEFCVVD